jgi:hypothetical protein
LGVDPSTAQDWEAGCHQPTKRNENALERVIGELSADAEKR